MLVSQKAITIAIFVIVTLQHAQSADNPLVVFQHRALALRNIDSRREAAKADFDNNQKVAIEASKGIQEIDGLGIGKGDLGGDFFSYFRSLLLTVLAWEDAEFEQSGLREVNTSWQEALKALADLTGSRYVGAEALISLSEEFCRGHYLGRPSLCEELAQALVPVMAQYKFGDDGISIRLRNAAKMRRIAEQFLVMRMYPEASAGFQEVFYANCSELEYDGASWVSAGLAEFERGDISAMAEYLAKAIVFGSEQDMRRALQLLRNARFEQPARRPPLPELGKLKEICASYAELNMHPRALQILSDYPMLFGREVQDLRTRYQNEWVALLDRYCFETAPERRIIYGQTMLPREKMALIIIPEPYRTNILQKAYVTVQRAVADMLPIRKAPEPVRNLPMGSWEWACLQLRQIEGGFKNIPTDAMHIAAAKALSQLDSVTGPIQKDEGSDFISIYRALLVSRSGDQNKAAQMLAPLVSNEILAPKVLAELREVLYPDRKGLTPVDRMIAELVPCSDVARWVDESRSSFEHDTTAGLPGIPRYARENLGEIGDLFCQMGMAEQAADAYQEVLAHSLWENDDPVWMRLAQARYLMGDLTGMADALGHVMVYGGEAEMLECLAFMDDVRKNPITRRPRLDPDEEKLRRIIELYATANLHPRALQVLDEFAQFIKGRKQLQQDLTVEWIGLLKRYEFRHKKRFFLFGQNLTGPHSRLEVVIRRPCERKVILRVQGEVNDLIRRE